MSARTALADRIRDELLAPAPDPAALTALVAREHSLAPEDAKRVVRGVVLQLNAAYFPALTSLELIHTEGCNLGCSYCFEREMLGYRRMPPEVARAGIDLLFDYAADGQELDILHFGGEPTVNMRGVRAATEYAEQRAAETGRPVRFDMTSNGVLIDEDKADYFAEHRIQVLLSVDGLAESHDAYRLDKRGRPTFERVARALEILNRTQGWTGVKMTVMPANAHRLYDDVLGLAALGANQFVIGHASGVEWPPEALAAYEEQFTRVAAWYAKAPPDRIKIAELDDLGGPMAPFFGCQAGRTSITVTVDGRVSPCAKILALDKDELLAELGDVEYGLTHLRNRQELVGARKVRAAAQELGIADEYQGGCFACNFETAGDLFQPSMDEHRFTVLERRAACAGCSKAS